MAFPSIAGTITPTNGTGAAGTKTIALPTGITAGETLVCLIRTTELGAHSFPAGWVELFDDASDASDDQTCIAWKKADGSEGSSVSVTSFNTKFSALTWRVAGAADPTVTPPESSTIAIGSSTTPNPTTCTPTGGAKDYLWVWCGGWEGEQTSPPATPPTNYGAFTGANSGTGGAITTNSRVAICSRTNNAASEDAGAVTISVTDEWLAVVVAFHPAPPGATLGGLTALTASLGTITVSGGDVNATHVQGAQGQNFGNPATLTLTGVTAGSALVLAYRIGAASLTSLTDDKSNTWVPLDNTLDGVGNAIGHAYALNVAAGTTIVTLSAVGSGFTDFIAHEVAGVLTTGALGQHAVNVQTSPGTATDAVTSGSVTTTTNGEYIFAWDFDTASNTAPSLGTGYTAGGAAPSTGRGAYQIQSAAGSIAATFTETETTTINCTGILTLKVSSGAGSPDVTVNLTTAGLLTASRGTLTETHDGTLTLSSSGLTAARGTLTESHPSTVALTSPALLTAARGTLTETHPGTVALTSSGLTAARGTLTESHPSTVTLSSPALLTGAPGTMTPSGGDVAGDKSVTLTSAGLLTAARGTLTESHPSTVALTSSGLTAARGTLTETHPSTVALTSSGLTAARGTVTETHPSTVALTSSGLTAARGTLTETHDGTVALTSSGLTAARGTLTETHPGTVTLTSPALLTGAAGSLTPSGGDVGAGDKAVNLTTAGLLTAARGTLTESHPSTVALTTAGLATATAGTLTETHPSTVALAGFQVSAASGGLTESHPSTVALLGASLTAARGILTETHPSTVALTSSGLTAARGTLTETHPSTVTLTSAALLTGAPGTLTPSGGDVAGDKSVTLTSAGLLTAARGTLTESHPSTVSLTGWSVTAARGLLTPSTTITLLGKSATVTTGTIGAARAVALVGLEALTVSTGTLYASGGTLEVPLQTDTAIGVAEVRVGARGVAECRVSVTGTAWSVVAEVVGTEAD